MSMYEPALRMAVTGIQNARQYADRLPEGDALIDALEAMDEAVACLRWYATVEGIDLHDSMPT